MCSLWPGGKYGLIPFFINRVLLKNNLLASIYCKLLSANGRIETEIETTYGHKPVIVTGNICQLCSVMYYF